MTGAGKSQVERETKVMREGGTIRFKARTALIRPALDALVAFAFIALAWTSAPSSASPNVPGAAAYQQAVAAGSTTAIAEAYTAPVMMVSDRSGAGQITLKSGAPDKQTAWWLLALAFSAIAALNLAVFRHLRHAYALPRRKAP